VASASIGQVHLARLRSGEKVAVKVQYPDIETIVATDLRALKRISRLAARLLPDWGWNVIYSEIQKMVMSELDYRQEAEAMATIAGNFTGRADVLIPRVFGDYSTGRVLITQWMDGVKVGDLTGIASAGIDRLNRRACASRPTANRSSSTACTTRIRTRGTCCCRPVRAAAAIRSWCSSISAPRLAFRPACARASCPSCKARSRAMWGASFRP